MKYTDYKMLRKEALPLLTALGLLLILDVNSHAMKSASIKLNNFITIIEIDEGAYQVVHKIPFGRIYVPCNSMLVRVSDKDFIWCDTPYEPESTKLVYEWIKKQFGDINLIEINTGFHADNLGGNEFLLSKAVPIYGSDVTVKLIRERGPKEKEKIIKTFTNLDTTEFHQACRQMTFKPPDKTFRIEEGLTLKIGGETIDVYYPGPTHTIDNTVVYFHKRKMLFGGCMIKSLDAKNAGNTADADMQKWPRSVEKVLARYKDARIVVPGHGDCGDIGLLKYTIELLDKVNKEAMELKS
jgi:glyoxylase-like metal-dependent hydrolase (beta-lactamase superfamily II)